MKRSIIKKISAVLLTLILVLGLSLLLFAGPDGPGVPPLRRPGQPGDPIGRAVTLTDEVTATEAEPVVEPVVEPAAAATDTVAANGPNGPGVPPLRIPGGPGGSNP